MRVVLASVGTRGDVQPMLALGQALARRGHEVIVACPESHAQFVGSHGFEHRALGEDMSAMLAANGGAVERSITRMKLYFTEQMALQAPRLLEIANGAHAIAGTGMAWTAPSVAEKLGIPALCVLPSTAALRSRRHPPPLISRAGLPKSINALLWALSEFVQDRLMGEPVNVARSVLSLKPIDSFTRYLFERTPCAIAADEALLPPDPAWQGCYPYTGFLFLEDARPLEPALDAWLANGDPPVCIGFGSMAGAPTERVGALLEGAIARTGRRCLVLSGASGLFAAQPPAKFFVVREAPHAQLLSRVAVFVHHGGSGTMASALRAGVPQVVLPMMLDQFHHAHHLVRAGLAPKAPSMAKVTAARLAAAIAEALELPPEPRQQMAARLLRSDAGTRMSEMLESRIR